MASSSFVSWNISFTIWWEPRNPNVIKMCTGDPRFVNDEGGRPGRGSRFRAALGRGTTTRRTSTGWPVPSPTRASLGRRWCPESPPGPTSGPRSGLRAAVGCSRPPPGPHPGLRSAESLTGSTRAPTPWPRRDAAALARDPAMAGKPGRGQAQPARRAARASQPRPAKKVIVGTRPGGQKREAYGLIQAWPPRAGRAAHQMPVRGSRGGRSKTLLEQFQEGFGGERGDCLAPDVHHRAEHEEALPGVERNSP